ncbi:membrane-anchored ubiquitin-fold protein 3-like [Trifolium pratense]|uniref:Membrane-anchored ubiquitin-fold protein 3-like n=1 Tax=Trifolium pratense TaxID=57577 RepID=A0A2K3PMJ4_TRIPR|nr:membrane-anchored ubiquitin-fold protein 3-like [Trifolium pratense]
MPEEDLVDIKFRLYDGSDIGPFRYSSAATVDMLKQRIVSDWPKELWRYAFLLKVCAKDLGLFGL